MHQGLAKVALLFAALVCVVILADPAISAVGSLFGQDARVAKVEEPTEPIINAEEAEPEVGEPIKEEKPDRDRDLSVGPCPVNANGCFKCPNCGEQLKLRNVTRYRCPTYYYVTRRCGLFGRRIVYYPVYTGGYYYTQQVVDSTQNNCDDCGGCTITQPAVKNELAACLTAF